MVEIQNFHHNFPRVALRHKHGSSSQTKTTLCCNTFAGCQISITQKSQVTRCTLLKEFFDPVQSDEESSDNEEEMEQDDDPSYVPDPKEIEAGDDDAGIDDFDDCLHEYIK